MDIIKINDEKKCNEILNTYRKLYAYDYKKDYFLKDSDNDIDEKGNLKAEKKENLFKTAKMSADDSLVVAKKKNITDEKKLTEIYKESYKKITLNPYNSFSRDKSNAYKLAKCLGIRVCPYCNINYIYVVKGKNKDDNISRPDFDHFYSKSKHPELQLRLRNLVPSCLVCNRTIKHEKEFDEIKNLNPYMYSFDKIKYFDIDFSGDNSLSEEDRIFSVLKQELPEENFQIVFRNKPDANKKDIIRADGNIKDLKLLERYQYHKDVVVDIIKKYRTYNQFRLNELANYSESKKMLFDSLFSELTCSINNTSLGKLKKDIIKKYVK